MSEFEQELDDKIDMIVEVNYGDQLWDDEHDDYPGFKRDLMKAINQAIEKHIIGEDSHRPMFADRPKGPHVMENEKNDLRADQRKKLHS